ncbi:hypothetical protein FKW31_08705 [Acetobacter sp. DmW_136]|uniref:hypothetical protein n=1 Tax=Acetobacter sp. DmW_136 TaxID=2591091 RepID=UPI0012396309|nr:hypothetical protein [Acetobacter sp. DmW_136]KAA8385429.1 hypothetical protein FKW31_08705 [Acetobacter sp. DmW_136]
MTSFSIDLSADRIIDQRTRDYFAEVSRSFANECYRSSLVMLWTVVVCDLVYKLQTLRDLYSDTSAGKLLTDVETKRLANPTSPDWEIFLLDEVFKRTKMLEISEHAQLKHLQQLRHFSAHPVLSGTDLLFRPTKEDARAQIRMALEALLMKPALFSKKIVETLVTDIAANKAVLISREKLKAYLEARYLPNMPLATERELFRALWKFCFKLNNAETVANRQINLDALSILYARNRVEMRTMINGDRPAFSNVGPDAQPLDALILFLVDYPELYSSLDRSATLLVDGRLAADINNRAMAHFTKPDMAAHLAALDGEDVTKLATITETVWQSLLSEAEAAGVIDEAVRIAIKIYGKSENFDAADKRFSRFIKPILPKLTVATLTELLAECEANPQTYGRARATYDHPLIKALANTLKVDLTLYPSL